MPEINQIERGGAGDFWDPQSLEMENGNKILKLLSTVKFWFEWAFEMELYCRGT